MSETKQRTVVKKVTNAVLYSDGTIRIDKVRASYPHVFKPFVGESDDGKEKASYGIQALLPKATHEEAKKLILDRINELLRENKVEKIAADKRFIRNGDDMAKDETVGMFVVSARETQKPDVRDASNRKMGEGDEDKVYGGCWVHILIQPWFQNHQKYGKRVNARLKAVMFWKDDAAFGTGRITEKDVSDSFDDLADGGDAFAGAGSATTDDDEL